MNTDFPTTELHFALAFNYCRLRVYTAQEAFVRKVLDLNKVEYLKAEDSAKWHDVDTRMVCDLICEALPEILGGIDVNKLVVDRFMQVAGVKGRR